ncbi:MAG: hypothetical protein SFT94_08355 [Pseudanabaenaceae cyanobacterium bins.68]|nr:hypothetical protein [Pseudanabaenaceae cyanobacterium bins.68]
MILLWAGLVLGGCQGTEWGTSLGTALAPPSAEQSSGSRRSDPPVVLPAGFPRDLPIPPTAKLVEAIAPEQGNFGMGRWQVSAPREQVWQFYGQAKSVQPSPLVLTKNLFKITLTVEAVNADQSELFIHYQPLTPADPPPEPGNVSSEPFSGQFTDLDQAPLLLQPYLKDLNRLGMLDPLEPGLFAPNRPISRRVFARWLFRVNNLFYSDRLARQIQAALPDQAPSFIDLGSSDPDFAIIQGLANGGLIGSADPKLPNRFAPGSTISREQALIWKVPFDYPQLPGAASLAAVQKAWGFSDRLSSKGLQVVLADAQGGDLANIRRAFGFIRVLQPTKPLTRAEAAAILWHFGGASDGINAQAVIRRQP